ncbi:hypothetical protein SCHPADRAFT_1000715 [Schizopora paradoxa]|uniref:DUF6533 domain-containing protein n=1 Tax=Schizopora paradoxa TaxID=27342 RepID=A0A0H2RBF8_9AGAM|nr:hypothetical protein SCHPADRAFT_1000715 [Schizopora paradoxa]
MLYTPAQNAAIDYAFHSALCSTFAVLAYEYLLTFQEEVRYIWNRRVNLAKLVFIMNRYVPLANSIYQVYFFVLIEANIADQSLCKRDFKALLTLTCFGFVSAASVLSIRAYAVWPSAKLVRGLVLTMYTASVSASAYTMWIYVSGTIIPPSLASGCEVLITNNRIWIAILVLALSDAVRYNRSSLLVVMSKDGIGYYACVVAISIANILVLLIAEPVIRDVAVSTQAAFQNILCIRLLLHLHVVNDPQDETKPATHVISFRRPSGVDSTTSYGSDAAAVFASNSS